MIDNGYCECGCGEKTTVAKRNDTKANMVKGRPMRFIRGHYRLGAPGKPLFEQLRENVDKSGGEDACWNWMSRLRNGYGYINIGSTKYYAHRVAYEQYYGEIPDGLLVLHSCDNRTCCNPKHLRVGTHLDNINDMITRGRQSQGRSQSHRGESNPAHKLTEKDVAYIRQRYSEGGITMSELACQMSVTESNVALIIKNKSWKPKSDFNMENILQVIAAIAANQQMSVEHVHIEHHVRRVQVLCAGELVAETVFEDGKSLPALQCYYRIERMLGLQEVGI